MRRWIVLAPLSLLGRSICLAIIGIAVLSLLNSCEMFKWDPADARKVSPNADERARKNVEEGKGFSIMGGTVSGGGNNKLSICEF